MCWVPGHVDIAGNEKADAVAKTAAQATTQALPMAIPHTDMKRSVREVVLVKWREKWNSFNQEGSKLREIKKDIGKWKSSHNKCRRIETALCCQSLTCILSCIMSIGQMLGRTQKQGTKGVLTAVCRLVEASLKCLFAAS